MFGFTRKIRNPAGQKVYPGLSQTIRNPAGQKVYPGLSQTIRKPDPFQAIPGSIKPPKTTPKQPTAAKESIRTSSEPKMMIKNSSGSNTLSAIKQSARNMMKTSDEILEKTKKFSSSGYNAKIVEGFEEVAKIMKKFAKSQKDHQAPKVTLQEWTKATEAAEKSFIAARKMAFNSRDASQAYLRKAESAKTNELKEKFMILHKEKHQHSIQYLKTAQTSKAWHDRLLASGKRFQGKLPQQGTPSSVGKHDVQKVQGQQERYEPYFMPKKVEPVVSAKDKAISDKRLANINQRIAHDNLIREADLANRVSILSNDRARTAYKTYTKSPTPANEKAFKDALIEAERLKKHAETFGPRIAKSQEALDKKRNI